MHQADYDRAPRRSKSLVAWTARRIFNTCKWLIIWRTRIFKLDICHLNAQCGAAGNSGLDSKLLEFECNIVCNVAACAPQACILKNSNRFCSGAEFLTRQVDGSGSPENPGLQK